MILFGLGLIMVLFDLVTPSGFNLLIDEIGYVLVILGLLSISSINDNINKSAKVFLIALVISLASIIIVRRLSITNLETANFVKLLLDFIKGLFNLVGINYFIKMISEVNSPDIKLYPELFKDCFKGLIVLVVVNLVTIILVQLNFSVSMFLSVAGFLNLLISGILILLVFKDAKEIGKLVKQDK